MSQSFLKQGQCAVLAIEKPMISFKGGAVFKRCHSLRCFFLCPLWGVSYRDLEEIMEERGVKVDHAALNRRVNDYSPLIAEKANGFMFRAVDTFGGTVDFIRSEQRDEMAATAFFKQSINNNRFPH